MPAREFTEHLGERIARLEPHFTVLKPAREGRYPVVLMLHGCGGTRPFIAEMAEIAVAAGAAAVIIDSYAPRRIGLMQAYATVCTGARLQGPERAGDLYAAVAWTRSQPWADRDRIAAIGWSHGAWTILDALSLRPGAEMERRTGVRGLAEEPLEGLAGALAVYPYTGLGSYVGKRAWRMTPKHAAAIVAQHDYIVGESRTALEKQRTRGAFDIHYFEGATHAFEDAEAADVRVRYNASATAREHDLLRAMIAAL